MYIAIFHILTVTGPSALTVNTMKNIESSSIVVWWDAVDDFLHTTYTIFWTNGRDLFDIATLNEQTSYTITGLTLDTVYTITVSAANMCGGGPEFRASVSFSIDTTSSTISTISPTTTTVNPTTTMSITTMVNGNADISVDTSMTATTSSITTTTNIAVSSTNIPTCTTDGTSKFS